MEDYELSTCTVLKKLHIIRFEELNFSLRWSILYCKITYDFMGGSLFFISSNGYNFFGLIYFVILMF